VIKYCVLSISIFHICFLLNLSCCSYTNILYVQIQNVSLSVNDILACCGLLCGAGCAGGTPFSAWIYLANHGVVTEEVTNFHSFLENKILGSFLWSVFCYMCQCDPYFDQIGCSHPGCEPTYRTPKCVKKCVNGNQLWETSKHYSVKAYTVNSDPQDIMAEVYKNGPVEVAFTVYEVNENFSPSFCN